MRLDGATKIEDRQLLTENSIEIQKSQYSSYLQDRVGWGSI